MKGFIEVKGSWEFSDFSKTIFININQIVIFYDYEIFVSNSEIPFNCDKTKEEIKRLIENAQSNNDEDDDIVSPW